MMNKLLTSSFDELSRYSNYLTVNHSSCSFVSSIIGRRAFNNLVFTFCNSSDSLTLNDLEVSILSVCESISSIYKYISCT